MILRNKKRTLALLLLIPVITLTIFWQGVLTKNGILTIVHSGEIKEIEKTIDFKELDVPEFEWFRVVSYKQTDEKKEIQIYYTNGELGKKTAWIATLTPNGKNSWSCSSQIMWSNSGSADNFPWEYWHHYLWNQLSLWT